MSFNDMVTGSHMNVIRVMKWPSTILYIGSKIRCCVSVVFFSEKRGEAKMRITVRPNITSNRLEMFYPLFLLL